MPSSTSAPPPGFVDRPVDSLAAVTAIAQQLRTRCLAAARPEHRELVAALRPVEVAPLVGRPLCKVLSKLLAPYATQQLGGFEVQQPYTRTSAYAHLRQALLAFDGLSLGIEASIASCVTDIPHFVKHNHQQEAVVYSRTGRLHPRQTHAGPRGLAWNRYVPEEGPEVTLFHSESGTMDPRKSGPNRALFFEVLRGGVPALTYAPTTQLSFWDVNVDLTDSPAVPSIPGEASTLILLQAFSRAHPVQFLLPAGRVVKQRVPCRPLANNQVHKGGLVQRAESMVAVAPRDWEVEALDPLGLYVLREGGIHHLRPGQAARTLPSPDAMAWPEHAAFSPQVFLDHLPIAARLNGRAYRFWNFMDVRSSKGIGEDWYDRAALDAQDAELWRWLVERFG